VGVSFLASRLFPPEPFLGTAPSGEPFSGKAFPPDQFLVVSVSGAPISDTFFW
jgi:hypothetical protein